MMTNTPKNNFASSKVYKDIVDERGIKNVVEVLKTGFLSKPEGGAYVKALQNEMSKILHQTFCFATTSGTSSLHGAIASLDLKNGDEVLIPALANIADASVVIQERLKPIFIDVSENNFNIEPELIEKNITKKTRALIVVHMYGQPAKIDELRKIAVSNNLILIEDCAQAAGATYKGLPVGSFGNLSCFSFYQTKHIVCGEGGLIATNNAKYAYALSSILNNGIKRDNLDDYDYDRIGFNYQMTEIQAALTLAQIPRQTELNEKRRKHADIYRKTLADTDISFQEEATNTKNNYFYLTGLLPNKLHDKRDAFIEMLKDRGVPVKKLYPLSLPEIQIIRSLFKTNPQDTPIAQNITKRIFNLYVNPAFNDDDITKFAETTKNVYLKLNNSSKFP